MKCPKCEHTQENTIECESCGILFDRYFNIIVKKKLDEAIRLYNEKKYLVALDAFKAIINAKLYRDKQIDEKCEEYICKIWKLIEDDKGADDLNSVGRELLKHSGEIKTRIRKFAVPITALITIMLCATLFFSFSKNNKLFTTNKESRISNKSHLTIDTKPLSKQRILKKFEVDALMFNNFKKSLDSLDLNDSNQIDTVIQSEILRLNAIDVFHDNKEDMKYFNELYQGLLVQEAAFIGTIGPLNIDVDNMDKFSGVEKAISIKLQSMGMPLDPIKNLVVSEDDYLNGKGITNNAKQIKDEKTTDVQNEYKSLYANTFRGKMCALTSKIGKELFVNLARDQSLDEGIDISGFTPSYQIDIKNKLKRRSRAISGIKMYSTEVPKIMTNMFGEDKTFDNLSDDQIHQLHESLEFKRFSLVIISTGGSI